MGGRGVILTLTIGDVKIVTLVGQCPNNFVQDCSSLQARSLRQQVFMRNRKLRGELNYSMLLSSSLKTLP